VKTPRIQVAVGPKSSSDKVRPGVSAHSLKKQDETSMKSIRQGRSKVASKPPGAWQFSGFLPKAATQV
jgi:hypothetical protein